VVLCGSRYHATTLPRGNVSLTLCVYNLWHILNAERSVLRYNAERCNEKSYETTQNPQRALFYSFMDYTTTFVMV